ncbi:Heat shock 70 kDa protein 12A [Rhizophlyctis rosea]|nr:Heat shock 70 kDa protein 12A [Rhizophlyctis rosea]
MFHLHFSWPNQPGRYSKNLTALLYKDNVPIQWGYAASTQFLRLSSKDKASGRYTYLDKFKLALDKKARHQLPQGFTVQRVIADYLRFLTQHVMADIRTRTGDSTLNSESVKWIITVPATWTDWAKDIMAKAAMGAGMVDDPASERLAIIYEPEAAAICCLFNGMQNLNVVEGETIMTVDMGGGTIDITIHRVMGDGSSNKFREATRGGGKTLGSTFVDSAFLAWYEAWFKSSELKDVWERSPDLKITLLKEWEELKRTYDGHVQEDSLRVAIHPRLQSILEDFSKERMSNEPNRWEDDFEYFQLTHQDMQSFFGPSVRGTIQLMEKLQRRLQREKGWKVDKHLLVGGFAESLYVREQIKSHFPTVIAPFSPGEAVVIGAAKYGADPSIIAERVSRYGYGTSVTRRSRAYDPEDLQMWNEDEQCMHTRGTYKEFVSKGEPVPVDRVVDHTFYPWAARSTSVTIVIYALDGERARYVHDRGVHRIGEINVDVPLDPAGSNKRPVKVSMHFGRTRIRITAKNEITEQEYSTEAKFAWDMASNWNAGTEEQPDIEESDDEFSDVDSVDEREE